MEELEEVDKFMATGFEDIILRANLAAQRQAQRAAQPTVDPLTAALQGLQSVRQAQDINQAQALAQLQQQLGVQKLTAQLDPNYQAQQDAAKIAFEVDKARQLAQVERDFLTPKTQSLEFRDLGDAIGAFHPVTGAEVSRTAKTPGRELRPTDRGLFDSSINAIIPGTEPIVQRRASDSMKGYDTKSGLYGIFDPDERGLFPEGVVPESQVPKPKQLKPLPVTQSDQFSGYNLLERKVEDIEKVPGKVRASNVGWIDSTLGYLQGLSGVGKKDSVALNDAFRSSVDTLIGEFSFGRGGKSLTVGERTTLAKYLPALTQSDAQFESRLGTFKELIRELRQSRIQALEDSGYDISKLQAREEGRAQPSGAAPVRVTTKKERDALAPGTQYTGSDGKVYTRK